MRIAYLSDAIYPYNLGGKEKRLFDITQEMIKSGNEVHIYTMNWWNGKKEKKENGVTLHAISKHHPLYIQGTRSIKQGLFFGLSAFKLLKEDFDVLDADHMVYFHLFPAKLACFLKGKKLVVTWHEVWGKEYWKKYLGSLGIFGYLIERIASKLPNKIISVSELTTKKLIEQLKVPKSKIVTIPNGINIKEIQKIKQSKEKSDIIFSGRLVDSKNVDLLIKSLVFVKKSNKNIKLVITGEGPELNYLKSLSKSLNVDKNIIFKGFIKQNEVYSLMKSSKVFVLPSEREGFGIVAIEAMACSIPVVTVNAKDNASQFLIQEGKNGFVSPLYPEDLAKAIQKALNKRLKMKASALNTAKHFDWENIINKLQEIYKR